MSFQDLRDPLMREFQQSRSISEAVAGVDELLRCDCHRLLCVARGAFRSIPCDRSSPHGLSDSRGKLDALGKFCGPGVRNEEAERLADPGSCLMEASSLRVAASHRRHPCDPGTRLVLFEADDVSLLLRHVVLAFRSQPEPRHGSRSLSIWRMRPSPRSSPACTGTVERHHRHCIRTCDPRWRTSPQPRRRRIRSSSRAVILAWDGQICLAH